MTLLVVGANHHSAATAELEALAAVDPEALAVQAITSPFVAEAMVVSTCNRVELYAEVDRFHAAIDDVVGDIAKLSGLTGTDLRDVCYVHYDERAVQHLFEVSAGLDSLVVGEGQILGQVRSALTAAQDLGTAGRELNEVGQVALRVGKDVRSQTGLDRSGANVVSVGFAAAADALAADGIRPEATRVLILGAGAMSSLAVAHASRLATRSVTVASRSTGNAERLAQTYDSAAADLADLPELLAAADLVVSCTAAREVVIPAHLVRDALGRRAGRPLVVLDLALPHDSDPSIADLPRATRLDLAMLADRPEARADRSVVGAAQTRVAEELDRFVATRAERAVEPVLISLRSRGSAVVESELDRLRDRLPGLSATDWALIEQALRRTVNTLMHTPTVRMKQLASDPDGQRYADALTALFELSSELVDQVVVPRDPETGPRDVGGGA